MPQSKPCDLLLFDVNITSYHHLSSLKADNSRCLLIDWDNSSGPTTYIPSRCDHDTTQEEEAVDTSDNATASGSTRHATLTAQESMTELATRTVGYIQSDHSQSRLPN